jgi:hypothetical protein
MYSNQHQEDAMHDQYDDNVDELDDMDSLSITSWRRIATALSILSAGLAGAVVMLWSLV